MPKVPLDVWVLHLSSEAEPSHPVEEIYFYRLYPQSNSYGHFSNYGFRWELEQSSTGKSKVLPSGTAPSSSQPLLLLLILLMPPQTTCPSNPPFYSHSWTRPQTLAAAIYPQPRRNKPPFSFYGFKLGGADFNPSCFTLAANCLIIRWRYWTG